MKTHKKIERLESRPERFAGEFSSFQELGSRYYAERKTEYSNDPFSEKQNELYKRTLYGLSLYSEQDIKSMHFGRKNRIIKKQKRAQKELNLFKQERVIEFTNAIFGLFKNSQMANEFVELYSDPDPKYVNKMSLKDLNINKEDIVDRFIEKNVLPDNFKSLT